MLPLLIVIPGVFILWHLAKKAGAREASGGSPHLLDAVEDALGRRGHAAPRPISPHLPPGSHMAPPPAQSVSEYLQHLQECTMAAAALNTVRPAAINADFQALERAPDEAVHALAFLSQPMDLLTVQRDLNVLGANPPLHESGHADEQTIEAIKGLQERFKQTPTGIVDPGTAVAIRYSVGVIHGQNQMGQNQMGSQQ
jgi:hypothetical protein